MFVGREPELETLNDLYSRQGSKTCAIYGRRRMGKTSLVEHFCEGKDSLRISFVVSSEEKNVELMLSAMERYTGKDLGRPKDFGSAMDILADVIRGRNTVVFFDEFPYLVAEAPYAPSVLQHFIDHGLKKSSALLIVCGSSISMMTEQLDGKDMPLFGRFINRIVVKELPYKTCELMHPGMDRLDALKVYMTVGGVPAYHESMCQKDYSECIARNFLGPSAPLAEEASGMMAREVRPYARAEAMLSDIAGGTTHAKVLAEKEGISQTLCGRYLRQMNTLGMVDCITPMANTDRKTKVLRICDPLLDFRHRVLLRNLDIATSSDRRKAYGLMEHSIDTFLGQRFEYVCTEYLKEHFMCRRIGKWWGWDGESVTDIDVVAEVTDGTFHWQILAECKFTKKPVGVPVLRTLESKVPFVKGYDNIRLMLFSVGGFTEELMDIADGRPDLELVDLDGLFAKGPNDPLRAYEMQYILYRRNISPGRRRKNDSARYRDRRYRYRQIRSASHRKSDGRYISDHRKFGL